MVSYFAHLTQLNIIDLCRFDYHLDVAALPGLCEREVDEEERVKADASRRVPTANLNVRESGTGTCNLNLGSLTVPVAGFELNVNSQACPREVLTYCLA